MTFGPILRRTSKAFDASSATGETALVQERLRDDPVTRLVSRYSARARQGRGGIFLRLVDPRPAESVLDLGGGDGSHIRTILPSHSNITIADVAAEDLSKAAALGYSTVLLEEDGLLPFADLEFDVIFCSSVIEHATGEKSAVADLRAGRAFREVAWKHQHQLAQEIRRVGHRYFVQTPNKWFPIEAHTWLPCFQFLPREAQMRLLPVLKRWGWPKTTTGDWRLFTSGELQRLFPDSTIVYERFAGLTKSLIAVRA